ncbi:MAG: hypothetical protein H6736_14840 [Alphaproteobacteria bacterium]|nr:hypothetical protein [Alphaproteobacteria bacterium]
MLNTVLHAHGLLFLLWVLFAGRALRYAGFQPGWAFGISAVGQVLWLLTLWSFVRVLRWILDLPAEPVWAWRPPLWFLVGIATAGAVVGLAGLGGPMALVAALGLGAAGWVVASAGRGRRASAALVEALGVVGWMACQAAVAWVALRSPMPLLVLAVGTLGLFVPALAGMTFMVLHRGRRVASRLAVLDFEGASREARGFGSPGLEAIVLLLRGDAEEARRRGTGTLHQGLLIASALWVEGRVEEALADAVKRGLSPLLVVRCACEVGDVETAVRWVPELRRLGGLPVWLSVSDFRAEARATEAWCQALCGDVSRARALLDEARGLAATELDRLEVTALGAAVLRTLGDPSWRGLAEAGRNPVTCRTPFCDRLLAAG